jgi:hypothetical protein
VWDGRNNGTDGRNNGTDSRNNGTDGRNNGTHKRDNATVVPFTDGWRTGPWLYAVGRLLACSVGMVAQIYVSDIAACCERCRQAAQRDSGTLRHDSASFATDLYESMHADGRADKKWKQRGARGTSGGTMVGALGQYVTSRAVWYEASCIVLVFPDRYLRRCSHARAAHRAADGIRSGCVAAPVCVRGVCECV